MLAARVAAAVVAVLVLGWFAVLERDARRQVSGTEVLRAGGAPAVLESGERDLRAARLLNPDRRPDIDRALLLQALGRTRDALDLTEDVVRDEPDNLFAWGVLSVLAQNADPAAVRRALDARRRLDPVRARAG